MNSFTVSVPSKTFFTGEYLALLDGPAILLNTQPRFENRFILETEKEYYANPIANEENPLHDYWNENEDFLLDFESDFIDPHLESGGFGASSAQWATFYAFVNQYHASMSSFFDKTRDGNDFSRKIDFDFIDSFLKKYRSYTKDKFPPSGYDVISQWTGKVTYIDVKNKVLKRMDWPFDKVSFVLIKNNEKIATHEHLKKLGEDLKKIPEKKIRSCVEKVLKAFETHDDKLLIEGINENHKALLEADLVAPQSVKKIEALMENEYVLAAKGCGALGADVICVLVKTENLSQFRNYGSSESLRIVASEVNLSHGIEVKTEFENPHATLH